MVGVVHCPYFSFDFNVFTLKQKKLAILKLEMFQRISRSDEREKKTFIAKT